MLKTKKEINLFLKNLKERKFLRIKQSNKEGLKNFNQSHNNRLYNLIVEDFYILIKDYNNKFICELEYI